MPRTYGDKELTEKIREFTRRVEADKLGAGPITERSADPDPLETDTEGEGEEAEGDEDEVESPSRKKRRRVTKRWPVALPQAVGDALRMAQAATKGRGGPLPQPSDALLPACLAELPTDVKTRLWRLNGF